MEEYDKDHPCYECPGQDFCNKEAAEKCSVNIEYYGKEKNGMKVGDIVWVKGEIIGINQDEYRIGFKKEIEEVFGDIANVSLDYDIQQYSADQVLDAMKILIEMSISDAESIFGTRVLSKILNENQLEEIMQKVAEYEDRNTIKVGDVVCSDQLTRNGMVIRIYEDLACMLFKNGEHYIRTIKGLKKTGKHIDIESILEEVE